MCKLLVLVCQFAAYAFSPQPFNLHFTFGWHVVTFCAYSYNCEGDDEYRQVSATVCFRKITFIPNLVDAWHYCTFQDHIIIYEFFYSKLHSGNIVYWDQEFWTTDTGWHFEEWCIWYIHIVYMGDFSGTEHINNHRQTMLQEWWIEVSLHCILPLTFETVLLNISM